MASHRLKLYVMLYNAAHCRTADPRTIVYESWLSVYAYIPALLCTSHGAVVLHATPMLPCNGLVPPLSIYYPVYVASYACSVLLSLDKLLPKVNLLSFPLPRPQIYQYRRGYDLRGLHSREVKRLGTGILKATGVHNAHSGLREAPA